MFAVVALTKNCWLVPHAPNTLDAVSIKARIEVDAQRGQTGRSSRRPQALLLRHELAWRVKMPAADYRRARAAMLTAQDEPVLVPFWPAARKVADAAAMTSALTIAWTRGWAAYAINPVSLAGYDFFAPLAWGNVTQPPRLISQNSETVVAEFTFRENGPAAAALQPPADADTTLATPDAFAAPVFPFVPEGTTAPELTFGQVDVERRPIGPGRESADSYYPQARETVQQPSFKLKTSTAAIALLGWWLRRGGGTDPFWVATTQSIATLNADMAAGAGTLPTAALPAGIAIGDTLALLTTGQAPEFVRVSSLAGGVVHFSGATAAAHSRAWTTVAAALLARHTDEQLELQFRRAAEDWIADVTLAFRELAAEYAATDGEVRGTTIGRLPMMARLFQIDLDYSGATNSWYLTNWESGVTTPDAQVWVYSPIDFDKIAQSIDLEDDEARITARWFAGGPWENWRPGQLAATGMLTISRAPIAPDGSVGAKVTVWRGQLARPNREGAIVDQSVLGANALFSRKAPHILMRPVCWKRLYGVACALDIADWKFNAVINAVAAHTITIDTIARANGGGLPAGFGFADWFAPLGFVEWLSGGKPLRAEILGSTALAGGAITLTVGRTLGWAIGNAVVAVPGCDKMAATCWNYDVTRTDPSLPDGRLGKFDNHDNFGGARQMPAVSPNFVIPNTRKTPAKK